MKQFQIELSDDSHKALKLRAALTGQSMASIVRTLVNRFLDDEQERAEKMDEMWKDALTEDNEEEDSQN